MNKLRIGFIANPRAELTFDARYGRDSTYEIMYTGRDRHDVFYIPDNTITATHTAIQGEAFQVHADNGKKELTHKKIINLNALDVVVIRKDPPVDASYVALLQLIAAHVTKPLVINDPLSLLRYGEKTILLALPGDTPPSAISASVGDLEAFIKRHKTVVIKPLHEKGGTGVIKLTASSPHLRGILTKATHSERTPIIIQTYLPVERTGDIRIAINNGNVVGAFKRMPKHGDFRGNICMGATAAPTTLTAKQRRMAERIGARLARAGIYIAGIDIIADRCTEINITSPLLSEPLMPGIHAATYAMIETLWKRYTKNTSPSRVSALKKASPTARSFS